MLYTRIQSVTTTPQTKFVKDFYRNGDFVDTQNINRSNDCVKVKINNFDFDYFYLNGSEYESWTKHYGENDYQEFYVDANTGKVIGSQVDVYLTMPDLFGNCILILVIFVAGMYVLKLTLGRTMQPIESLAKIMRL